VPVVEVTEDTYRLGNAANVAANIRSLGGRVDAIGVVGDDAEGQRLTRMLGEIGAGVEGIIVDHRRPTTVKSRVMARHQQVVRIDRESRVVVDGEEQNRMIAFAERAIQSTDAVVVADVNKGVVTPDILSSAIRCAREQSIPVLVDPKVEGAWNYHGATLVTPNTVEAGQAAGIEIIDEESLRVAGERIMERLGLRHLLITRGELGMSFFEKEEETKITHIPTAARDVFDVTGAGDTVIAVCALALAAGVDMIEAARLSNYAAGIVVGTLGTATVSQEELLEDLER
jgi:D-beta-D-heptose 7-phosphate kinase/D-beta-D-heptose 1-phosphate adenosyltransferase